MTLTKDSIKYFIIRFFAIIGLVMTVSIGLGAWGTWHYFFGKGSVEEPPKEMVLTLDFTRPVAEKLPDFSLSLPDLLNEESSMPLIYILRALDHAGRDPKVKGVIARFGIEDPSLVHVQEIGAALETFRKSGKFAHAFATSYGDFAPGGNSYLLAGLFDTLWLQPIGAVGLSPLRVEAPFGKTALSKLGVETDFMRREEYKSVMENVARDSFSDPVKANMAAMLQSLNNQRTNLLARGRGIDALTATAILNQGPFTAEEAITHKLVTKLGYEDEFSKSIDDMAGKDAESVDPMTYLYYRGIDLAHKEPKKTIALIHAEGMIIDEAPSGPSRLAEDGVIDTQAIVDAFAEAAENKEIDAILFRVDSPGGSPVASETIRHALVKAKEKGKPVYVSMGAVAASGGYWISMNADRIIADPATITGSIGVIAGKFVLDGMFKKLGIVFDTISPDGKENPWSMAKPFNDQSRARMNAMLDATYKAFTENVAAARKLSPEKMPDVAKGRVYTGEQALKVGLVDELGGLDVALTSLKKQLGLTQEDLVALHQLPAPETPETIVLRILKSLRFGGAMATDFLGQWQKVMTTLSPWLHEIQNATSPMSATLPLVFRLH